MKMLGRALRWGWLCSCCDPLCMRPFQKRRQKRKEQRQWRKEIW